MIKIINKIHIGLLMAIILVSGCGGQTKQPVRRVRKIKKIKDEKIEMPKEFEQERHEYQGGRYRSPFSESAVSVAPATEAESMDFKAALKISSPENLKVTGFFADKAGEYVILTGVSEFYVVKHGRIYNEDGDEVPDIAAIIKKDKRVNRIVFTRVRMCKE
jgi:Tfp pilus assembly protein PilP